MGMNGIEFVLMQWLVAQSELCWNIIEASGREAAIEMPHPRNDDSHHRDLDVGARLIEHKKIEALLPGDIHAAAHLLARVETAELGVGTQLDHWKVAWRQIGMVLQVQRRRAVKTRFVPGPAPHQTDRQELVQFGQCAQQRDAAVKVRAGTKYDVFVPVLHPMRYGYEGRNRKIAGDVEHPKPASGCSKLGSQIADIGVVGLVEIHCSALQAVVPPDRICVSLDEFEEPLYDCFPERVAGCAAVGIRLVSGAVKKVQKPGRKVSEAFVAQRPDRRPINFGRLVEQDRAYVRTARIRCQRLASLMLGIAEEKDIVRMDGLA